MLKYHHAQTKLILSTIKNRWNVEIKQLFRHYYDEDEILRMLNPPFCNMVIPRSQYTPEYDGGHTQRKGLVLPDAAR